MYRAITCSIPHSSPSTTFLLNAPAIPLIETVVPIPLMSMTIDLEKEEEMIGPGMKGHMRNLDMILEKGVPAPDQVLLIPQGPVPLPGTMRKSLPLRPL